MPVDRDHSASVSGRLRAFGRRTGADAFFRWWLGELAGAVPRGARTAVQRRRMRTVLAFGADHATLWRPAMRGGEAVMEPIAQLPLAGEAATATGRVALENALGEAGGSSRLVVALAPRQALRRQVRLPAALEENLKQALGYDLDRHTPFKADELYFDAAIVARDAARNEIVVDLAAARRSVVDHAIAQAEAWGAEVLAVVPDAPDAPVASRLDLLPEERRARTSYGRGWQVVAPLVGLAVLVAVAVAVPVWQKREYAIALGRSVDEARAQASVSERLRGELDRLAGDYNFVLERKFAFPASVHVLDEITKLLPDDTWLTQMEMKSVARGKDTQRELLLRGESANAGRLITAFEESKVFTQAAPRSPTTKIQPGPGEIFDLTAQLRPLAAPAPVVLASAAGASPKGAPASATPSAGPDKSSPASKAPAVPPPSATAPAGAPAQTVDAPPPAPGAARPSAPTVPPAPPPASSPPSGPATGSVPPPGVAKPATASEAPPPGAAIPSAPRPADFGKAGKP
jgi:general secretion pathway protein L